MFRQVAAALIACLLTAVARADFDAGAFDGRSESDAAPVVVQPSSSDARLWVVVKAADKVARTRAANAGLAIEEIGPGTAAGVATPKALERLRKVGVVIVSGQPLSVYAKSFPPADQAYHDFDSVQQALAAIVSANKDLASLVVLGTSVQGKPITALRFNTTAKAEEPSSRPGAVFFGAHHAREHLSVEIPLLVARWLADNRGRADVRRLLETRDVYFVPLVNPDGAEHDIATGGYRWYRKNMSANADGSVGVDLNRNYDSHWGEAGDSGDPGDDTYRGPAAFSEPESLAVKAFFEKRPNLRTAVSYHSFAELILYPWSWGFEPVSDGPALKSFKSMAAKMAAWTGYTPEQSSALYASSGDACDWAWAERKVFCFTFELEPRSNGSGGFYPGPGAITAAFDGNRQSVLYLIDMADDPYRAGSAASSTAMRR